MKHKLLSLLLSLAMLLPCLPITASAADEVSKWAGDDGIIKVLAIGNSFTKDSFYFFDDVERAQDPDDEIKMVVGYLYEGGVPVQTHANNAVKDKEAYIYYKYDCTKNKDFTEVKSTTRNALLDEDWDLISIQQTPILSSDNGKEGGLETLVDFIRTHATNPKMKLGRHFTWAYGGVYQYTGPYKDQFISTYNASSEAMYQDIARFAKEFE